ncbi:MAG: response regulator transcription factor [Cyanobacteriota bacterium]
MDKLKVILVEDHVLTRIGLKTALQESGNIEVIAETEYGEVGVELTENFKPDAVLMDLGLPNMNGIDATKLIKSNNPSQKVIVLTSHRDENEVTGALGAGADAYCLKDINPQRLVSVIQTVVEGAAWLDPAIAKVVLRKFADENNILEEVKSSKSKSPLTERELQVLQYLADGASNAEIADELSLSQHTVKTHIGNILQKLSVDDRTQAVVRALREGWVH